jgi:hypothetical protein
MISKINEIKKIILITCIFLILGCSGNRFKDEGMINSFSFGLFGYDDTECREKYDPMWTKSYQNGVYPSKTCLRYRYYTCHTTHYCPNLPTQVEREKCNQDAAQYWTPKWTNAKGDLEKRVEITKRSCEIEQENCNNGIKNDTRCKHLPSEKYQKIVQESKSKNSQ